MDQFAPRPPGEAVGDDRDRGAAARERGFAAEAADRGGTPGDQDRDVLDLAPDHRETAEPDALTGGSAQRPAMPSRWIFVGVALVLVGLLAWGTYGHWKTSRAASDVQQQQAHLVPSVRVVKAEAVDGSVAVTLPGETQPVAVANIYARATGYIAERRVDIGSRVKKGDLLAHIAAPDLDQQLIQAVAQLEQVKAQLLQSQANVTQADANLNLAKVNLQRAQALVGKGFETLQNRDQLQANQVAQAAGLDAARAGVKVAAANVDAQQAAIDRFKALASFEDVKAPFDGVVTARNVDPGDLVNADASTGPPMFTVQENDVLRVYVQVPENAAVGVRDGLEARITVPQFPGRTFVGRVTRSAVALQTSARTLTVEVDVPNQDAMLRSGLYAYVSLAIPRTHPVVVVPAETLIFDQHGTRLAVVDGNEKIKMVPIDITRDLGTSIEVDQGPKGGDRVVLSPPATLRDGSEVKVEADEGGSENGPAPSAKDGSSGGDGDNKEASSR